MCDAITYFTLGFAVAVLINLVFDVKMLKDMYEMLMELEKLKQLLVEDKD